MVKEINTRQLSCIQDAIKCSGLHRQKPSHDFTGVGRHLGQTVKSLIDMGVFIVTDISSSGYPLRVILNSDSPLLKAISLLGKRVYFRHGNQSNLHSSSVQISGFGFKHGILCFQVQYSASSKNYYPLSSITKINE